jgi:hypothetical protein
MVSGAALGRPRVPPSRIASMSALRYSPEGPTYRNGFLPFLSKRLFTAPEEMPNFWAISNTVRISSSIYINLYTIPPMNQEGNVKYYLLLDKSHGYFDSFLYFVIIIIGLDKIRDNIRHIDIYLYNRIVKNQENYDILNFFWSGP